MTVSQETDLLKDWARFQSYDVTSS